MAKQALLRTLAFSSAIIATVSAQSIDQTTVDGRPTCTVHAGPDNSTDDTPTIVKAFEQCGHGGNVIFPEGEEYHINSKLNPVVNDVSIEWRGEWVFSEDIEFWRANNYRK